MLSHQKGIFPVTKLSIYIGNVLTRKNQDQLYQLNLLNSLNSRSKSAIVPPRNARIHRLCDIWLAVISSDSGAVVLLEGECAPSRCRGRFRNLQIENPIQLQ